MTPIFHALNTSTLAAWLSVTGFGAVGIFVPEWRWSPTPKNSEEIVTQVFDPVILLGAGDVAESAVPATDQAPTLSTETLPSPPELPELAEQAPLPEIPSLPSPAPVPEKSGAKPNRDDAPQAPARKSGGSQTRNANSAAASGVANAGPSQSDSARLAAGRMPAPIYPSASRQSGQVGTVTVAFTVDNSGRVISAQATKPTPWPLLNEAAVRAVRRWKFPPGGVMKVQRPIVFNLR